MIHSLISMLNCSLLTEHCPCLLTSVTTPVAAKFCFGLKTRSKLEPSQPPTLWIKRITSFSFSFIFRFCVHCIVQHLGWVEGRNKGKVVNILSSTQMQETSYRPWFLNVREHTPQKSMRATGCAGDRFPRAPDLPPT